jgi:hypothetical protein
MWGTVKKLPVDGFEAVIPEDFASVIIELHGASVADWLEGLPALLEDVALRFLFQFAVFRFWYKNI